MSSSSTMGFLRRSQKKEDAIIFGKVHGSFWKKAQITESELNHHVHIVGASGFGKTVLLSHLIRQRIAQGKGLLFLDLKGDIDTIETFLKYAENANRTADVQILSLGHLNRSTAYNLIGDGTATQIRDRIMLSLTWSEEFYRNQASSFLLKLFIGMTWLRDNRSTVVDLHLLLKLLNSREAIENLCADIPETELKVKVCMEEVAASCKSSDYWASLQGLRVQIESLVLSDFSSLISETEDGIDLFDSVKNGKIILIFLDTRRYGETAKAVGKFILQDLKSVSARIDAEVLKAQRLSFSVIIDEFADLAQEDFIGFLDRARSSRMSIVVAHQELCDLERISPEFAGRLMGNTSTIYAFLQKRGESAEMLAGVAGTRTVKRKTERYSRQLLFEMPTGETSVREVEEYVIHPNVIKSLRVGECVCIKKYPFARAYRIKVDSEKRLSLTGGRTASRAKLHCQT